jgi:cell division protease FtsH
MVTKWGLSDKIGPLTLGGDDEEVFLGHSITRHKDVSESTSSLVDSEVRDLIDRNYKRAENLLTENIDKLHAMAGALVKYETINVDQIRDIMEGKPARDPVGWDKDSTSGKSNQADSKAAENNSADGKQQTSNLDGEDVGTASAQGTTSGS